MSLLFRPPGLLLLYFTSLVWVVCRVFAVKCRLVFPLARLPYFLLFMNICSFLMRVVVVIHTRHTTIMLEKKNPALSSFSLYKNLQEGRASYSSKQTPVFSWPQKCCWRGDGGDPVRIVSINFMMYKLFHITTQMCFLNPSFCFDSNREWEEGTYRS